jgi:hypothetical protein
MERGQAIASYIVDKSVDHLIGDQPDIQRGSLTPWWHAQSLLAMDFVRERYVRRGTNVSPSSVIVVDRDSSVWRPDASSLMLSYAPDVLAQAPGVGVYIGGTFTNKIRNPRGEGGVLGVIGSGGALPTNALKVFEGGLSADFIGTRVLNGLPGFGVRIYGTATETVLHQLFPDYSTNAGAAPGQAWGSTAFVTATGENVPQVRDRLTVWAADTFVQDLAGAATNYETVGAVGALLQNKGVVSAATTTNVRFGLEWSIASGVAYDFEVWIYAAKLIQLSIIEGPELVTNGDFATDSDWIVGAGCVISEGAGNIASSVNIAAFEQSLNTNASVYKAAFSISNFVAGDYRFELRGASTIFGTNRAANGTFTEYLLGVPGNTSLRLRGGADPTAQASVDNFSIKKITAGYLPLHPILPPMGMLEDSAEVSDDVRVSELAWYSATGASEFVSIRLEHVADEALRCLFEYSDGTTDNFIRAYIDAADRPSLQVVCDGDLQVQISLTLPVNVGVHAFVFGWTSAGCYIVDGYGNIVSSPPLSLPVVTQKRIGGSIEGHFFNDTIKEIQICRPIEFAEAVKMANAALT